MGIPVFARLWWDGHRGHAAYGGVDVELREPPPVLDRPAEIDYSECHPGRLTCPPEVRRLPHERKREMTAPEVEAVRLWLQELSKAVGRFLQ